MKRHKPKPRRWYEPEPCDGCQWYHEKFGICCNAESEQGGDVSERCELYVGGEPQPGVKDEEEGNK